MKKEKMVFINPATEVSQHLPEKPNFCDYQTVHVNEKQFERDSEAITDIDTNKLESTVSKGINDELTEEFIRIKCINSDTEL